LPDDIVEKALGFTQAGVKLNRRSDSVSVSHWCVSNTLAVRGCGATAIASRSRYVYR
jgi:hypothetical protein